MNKHSTRTRLTSALLSIIMVLGIINIPVVGVYADVTTATVSDWSSLQSKITNLEPGGEICLVLSSELTPPEVYPGITIDSGKKVTLDLNGHNIVRQSAGVTNSGGLFTVTGSSDNEKSRLTITDTSSEDSDSKITGTHNIRYGGSVITVKEYGELYLENGRISDNSNIENGAGVKITGGTFVMNGGAIVNNTAYATTRSEYLSGFGCGGGVYVSKSGESDGIPGTFIMNGGKIWGNGRCDIYTTNEAKNGSIEGGGVYVGEGCTFEMNGGSFGEGEGYLPGNIVRNTISSAVKKGGNVYVAGTFHMTGGKMVSGESASAIGAGIYVADGGDFTMDGGEIRETQVGGSVYVDCGGRFTMNDGSLNNNHSEGVYINGKSETRYGVFTMTGGNISGNGSYEGGGVHVHNYAEFIMTGGTVSGNYSSTTDGTGGGGVYVGSDGRFYMSGGSITENRAEKHGAGIFVDDNGKLYLSKGQIKDNTISANTLSFYGAGIYLKGSARVYLSNDGIIDVTGNKNIIDPDDPKEDNIVFDVDQNGIFVFQEKIADGSELPLGFNTSQGHLNQTITEGYEDFYGDASPDKIFSMNQDGVVMRINEGEVQVFTHEHSPFYDNSKEDRVTVTCTVPDDYYHTSCGMTGTISISVPDPYYTGNPVLAKLTVDGPYEELTGLEVDESKIQYYYSNDLFNPLPEAPSEKGYYVARYKLGVEGSSVEVRTYYQIKECELVFNSQGHGNTPSKQMLASGSLATKPEDPQADGWAFGGWYTDSDCTEAWDFDNDTVTKSMTLYAKWTRCNHEGAETSYTWADDGSSCLASYKCDVCGYKVEENGSISSEPVKAATCSAKGDTKYTAVFSKTNYFATSVKTITDIDFDPDAHVWGPASYEWADDDSACVASRKCTLNEDHVVTETATISSEVIKEPSVTEEGTCILTAIFTKDGFEPQTKESVLPKLNQFEVTFDLQGVDADEVEKQLIVEGQKVTKPSDPSSDEYEFSGWFKDYECTEAWDFDNDTVTKNVTLHAKWTHSHDDGTVFTVWGQTDKMPAKPGNYCFIKDVMVSDPVFLAEGTWNYCLHGSTVKCHRTYGSEDLGGQNQHFINVSTGNSILNIYDCQDGSGKITMDWGSGIYVASGSVVNLYSGKIADCRKRIQSVGFGVEIYKGTFNMYGGSIEGGNNSGVYLSYQATFNMHGGTITDNKAYLGGGVRISGGSTFNISGGTITKNQMSETGMKRLGHGVYIDSGTMNIVAAPGKDTTSKIYIYENSRYGWHCNVDVKTGKINVLAKVDEESRIGIWHHDSPTPSNPVIVLTNGFKDNATITQIFPDKHYRPTGEYSDDYNYLPKINDSGELTLHLCYNVEFVPGEGTGETVTKTLFAGTNVYPEFMFKAPLGYGFVRWAKIGNASGIPGTEFEVNRDYTGVTAIGAFYEELPDINFTVDFGEGHEDLVSSNYSNYPVDGSKVTFTVPAGTTLHDAMYGIPIKFNDIQDNGDWFYGLFEVGAFGLKPAKQYASKAEYIQELEDSKDVPITDGTTIYALWFTPVENLVLTVKAPECGTVVNYDNTATEYPYQDVVPEISVSGDAVLKNTSWLAEDYKTGTQRYFDGMLTGDNTYFAEFYLDAKFGYTFEYGRDVSEFLMVNGATLSVENTGLVNGQLMGGLFSVAVSHKPGEMAVENESAATCTETGTYDEVVRCTGCKTIISSESKTTEALGHDWSEYVVTTPAQVGKKGVETSTCSRCKETQTRDIPALMPSATPTAKPTEKPITPSATPTSTPVKPTAKPTKAPEVTLTLDKKEADVVCGKTLTLKATLKGSTSKMTWRSSNKNIATVDANGKITAKQAGQVTITVKAAGKSASCTVQVLFKDVTNTKDFWYTPTYYLVNKDVVKGYDKQTRFKPANVCTRAQMVTFIWRLKGEPAPKAKTCKFSDVKKTDYFYKACIWGNENHIVEGYKNGTFGPQIVCARRHAVTFLWRLAGQPKPTSTKNKFKDVKEKDYFYKATLWASEKNILAGYSDGTFRPDGDCLRRQMVTFLYKYDKFVTNAK